MCQCRLHALLWLHIGIILSLLAAEPRSTAIILFPSQCLRGTILLTLYSMVRTDEFQEQSQSFFIGISFSLHFWLLLFRFLFFLSIGWYFGAVFFGLIGCKLLSPCLADHLYISGPCRSRSDLTVASSQYDILLCSETLVLDMRHVLELLVPGFGLPVLLCWGKILWALGLAAYVRDGYGAFRQRKF